VVPFATCTVRPTCTALDLNDWFHITHTHTRAHSLIPGMDGPGGDFDAILTQILNSYQPVARPASRTAIERLPRRRVRAEAGEQQQQQQGDGEKQVELQPSPGRQQAGEEEAKVGGNACCPMYIRTQHTHKAHLFKSVYRSLHQLFLLTRKKMIERRSQF